jgi:hypothetical protein
VPELLLIELLIGISVILLILGLGTQVIIPIFTNRPMFPVFRRRQKVKELEQVLDELDDLTLDRQIKDARKKADKMREPAHVVHIVPPTKNSNPVEHNEQ